MEEFCKVLIVDDEMLIRQGIINYIDWESEGFQIIGEASNGKEAMQMIEQFRPHIVVTDIVMPIMDGIDLVREGKKAFPEIEIIVLSSFEDFDYVRSTFQSGVADYILKPKLNGQELVKILNRVADRIPNLRRSTGLPEPNRSTEEMLENLLLGYESSLDKTVLSSVFDNSHFQLVAVYGENYNVSQFKTAFSSNATIFQVLSEEAGAIFLLNFNFDQLEAINEKIVEFSIKDVKVTWLVSEPFEKIDNMKNVYDECLVKMKKYLFYLPEKTLFLYNQLPVEQIKQSIFDLNHFIEMFKDRLFNTAFAYLENHIEYLSGQYNNDSFEFKSFLGNIVFNIIVLLDNMKYDTQDIERKKYNYFSSINEANHADEALLQFNGFLAEVRTIVLSNDEANEQANNFNKILAYIEQHYTQPLRLSEIADHFHFNASYLSSYFSTHHKEGFSEYLNRVRIKKSMELLENSNVSISNISGMVGYSEHSYFCKVFKRITGTSPGNYRKEHHAQNEEANSPSLKK